MNSKQGLSFRAIFCIPREAQHHLFSTNQDYFQNYDRLKNLIRNSLILRELSMLDK